MAARGRDRVRPRRTVRLEQTLLRAAGEGRVRASVPDVGLRVRLLRAEAVVDLLRAHVEPAHVDLGVRELELLLDEAEQVAAVRRVDGQGLAGVGAAGEQARREEAAEEEGAGCGPPHGAGVGWPWRFIISSYCLRCSGDMRLRASLMAFSCSGESPPTAKPVSL